MVLSDMLNFKYKSLSPIISFESGKACTSITLLDFTVDVILIVVKLISPFMTVKNKYCASGLRVILYHASHLAA